MLKAPENYPGRGGFVDRRRCFRRRRLWDRSRDETAEGSEGTEYEKPRVDTDAVFGIGKGVVWNVGLLHQPGGGGPASHQHRVTGYPPHAPRFRELRDSPLFDFPCLIDGKVIPETPLNRRGCWIGRRHPR